MKQIESEPGTHIRNAAMRLVEVAQTEDCFLIFNDICLAANKHSTVDGLVAEFDRLCEVRRAEYAASPEGKAAAAKQEAERLQLQARADLLMAELPLMDFTDLDLLIKWLSDIEESRDRIGVNVDAKLIQDVFKSHGFEPNAYCGPEFEKGNPEIEARWLIGQAIADQYVPMVRHFAGQLAK